MTFQAGSKHDAVTAAVTRRALPGHERELESWMDGVVDACSAFEGFLGADIIRPSNPGAEDYVLIYRFASGNGLAAWDASDVKVEWLRRAEPHTSGEVRRQVETGLEYWFRSPGAPAAARPPVWKMAVVTWLAIFPLSYLAFTFVVPHMTTWPAVFRSAVVAALLVLAMTYAVMPFMTRLLAPWLARNS
jgi:antibiotic biosynthesis monooxygenase (ABM) superfamily enzyme